MRTKSASKELTLRTKSSSNEFSVFEFNEEDEHIERTSRKLLGKYRKNPNKFGFDATPATKYNFLQCFAQGTKTRRKDLTYEPLDVDAVENAAEEWISVLDAAATSTSSNYKPVTHRCPNHNDTSSFCGSKSYTARTQNLGVTSTRSKDLDSTLPHFMPDNMPIGIDSDDDGSTELCSSRFASSPVEGPLEVQLQEHGTGGCDINMVVLSPEYVIYGDMVSSKSRLSFSCSCIKLDGSTLYGAKQSFSFNWAVTDILNIDSQWIELLETATLNLRLKSKDRKIAKNADGSGIMELKLAVYDPQWPKRQEEIKSLDVRYNDIWNVAFDFDAARSKDVLLGQNSIFFSKHYFVNELSLDKSFEEIIYPKGDPDAVSISKRDVQLLQPETFLNDTIIDFYILYLKNKVKPEETYRFHFFNSFFFRKLADLDKDPSRACESNEAFQRVRKWTRKLDIFEKDYIFIPVNFSLHWSLIVICHPGEVVNVQDEETENNSTKVPCILHMDSIKGSHRGLKNLIRSYLFEEWRERNNGPVEYASSKFFNFQFVPLEVPQQENSFDCGLFLLHYVELFLEQAPVNFSYSRISKSSKFLNKDWFPPAEASSKRAHIKRLIYKIVEDNSPKVSRSACDKYSSESAEADGEDTGLEFLLEIRNSSHDSCSDFDANPGVDVTPTPAFSLENLQFLKKSKLVCDGLLDRGDNATGSPTVWDCRNSGQIVSLNSFKNVVSPIEEGEENEEQSAYSSTHEASDKRVAETSEPLAMETSEEHEKGGGTSGNSGSPISSDMHTKEHKGFLGPNREEYTEVYECCSSSSDEFAGCVVEDSEEENGGDVVIIECESSPRPRRIMVVEDSEEENGGDDVIESESSPCLRRIIAASSTHHHSIEKIDLTENMVVSVLELGMEGAKRPRITDSEQRRRVTRRLSKEL